MTLHFETSAGYLACGAGNRDQNGTLHTTQVHEDVTCKSCRRTSRYRGEVAFLAVARQVGELPTSVLASAIPTVADIEAEIARGGDYAERARRFVEAFNGSVAPASRNEARNDAARAADQTNQNAGATDVR